MSSLSKKEATQKDNAKRGRRRSSVTEFFQNHNQEKTFSHSFIKKSENIPLLQKLNVQYLNQQRKSIIMIQQHQSEKNPGKTTAAASVPASHLSREGEGKVDVITEYTSVENPESEIRDGETIPKAEKVEKVEPTIKRASFALFAPLSMHHKVIPQPASPQFRGKLAEVKKASSDIQISDINSIFLFRTPKLYFR